MTDVGSAKKISIEDFEKIQLRVGTIKKVTQHPSKEKDYVILVDCVVADEDIQVVAGLVEAYKAEELLGKQVVVICNLPPEDVGGEESQGMLLISHANNKPVLITTEKECPPGAEVWGINDGEKHHHDEREH